ncbi:hypothetical protein [Paraburkholderia caribensis]|uniref:hypothetical protein n=1 Tax=Paraburkholderia caribensis TaxID=75105 RepID=UPI001CB10C81|nr:hypothetical protein [Paraburkholderia caribensis]CAG9269531.1 conserved hypothetical protein [Paraburkholderia caribensis]
MSIWTNRPVSNRCLYLLKWRILEVKPGADRHFIGVNAADGTGRVSSTIRDFDVLARRGITASGRTYVLVGSSHFDEDVEFTWNRWCRLNRIEAYVDITGGLSIHQSSN